ncbi:MAG: hypothetical protein L6R40_004506 [Gallowayella cf. fulva]|nr:MAG: hypothetical protein L6R40_004506 [Xanthomendoza cf. fulva]
MATDTDGPSINFLTVLHIKMVYRVLHRVPASATVRCNDTLLRSAVEAVTNAQKDDGESETDVIKLAAILATRIIRDRPFGEGKQPFGDGNERTALMVAKSFLSINGNGKFAIDGVPWWEGFADKKTLEEAYKVEVFAALDNS